MFGKNVDRALWIMLLKSVLRLDGWIFVDHGFYGEKPRERRRRFGEKGMKGLTVTPNRNSTRVH